MNIQDDKYPYLTAWLGFVAFMALSALLFGMVLPGLAIVFFVFYVFVGFFVFRWLIQHHLIGESASPPLEDQIGINARYPFLTAWLGFLAIHLLPTIFINYFAGLFRYVVIAFLINLILWITVNFFIFKFVVKRHIEPIYDNKFTVDSQPD